MNTIKIRKMSVVTEARHLIRNISLEISRNSIVSIMGANGSGKSTLLKAITGLVQCSSEEFNILGENVINIDTIKKSLLVAYMPQRIEVDEQLIVEDYFHYCRFPQMNSFRTLNKVEIELRDSILEKLKMAHLLKRKIGQISGGELKKVTIGGAFFQGSAFVMLDEPFQALDPVVKVEVAEFILSASRLYNTGVLMASHDLYWAKKLSSSMLFLKKGELQAYGTVDEVLTKENLEALYGQGFSLFKDIETNEFTFLPRANK